MCCLLVHFLLAALLDLCCVSFERQTQEEQHIECSIDLLVSIHMFASLLNNLLDSSSEKPVLASEREAR